MPKSAASMTRYGDVFPSPVGPLLVLVDGEGAVVLVEFPRSRSRRQMETALADLGPSVHRDPDRVAPVRRQLEEYFDGRRQDFDLKVHPAGTEFQHLVWAALRKIPYGTTTSYGELAASLGRPNSSRAVGAANGANPVSIIVPCHRVVGADGSLTGFGGGLETKRYLLDLEGAPCTAAGGQGQLRLAL